MASGDTPQSSTSHANASRPKKLGKEKVDSTRANLRKRQPRRLAKHKNDIYVTRRSNFAGQLQKCEKLLDAGESEIHLHGLGAAINRALNIALQLESRNLGTVTLSVSTATVGLMDDVEPLHDDEEFDTRERSNSAVHIRVFRTVSEKVDGGST